MSTFIDCYGECKVPEEKKDELAERVKMLLVQGGMMQTGTINGVPLISLPEYNGEKQLDFDYNYFENKRYPCASYDADRAVIHGDEAGMWQFRSVMSAAHVLREFYSDTLTITAENGYVIDAVKEIGWLNHLFGETYTNVRTQDLWEIHKLLRNGKPDQNLFDLTDDDTFACRSAIGELKYSWIIQEERFNGVLKCVEEEDGTPEARFSPVYCIKRMRKPLEKFRDEGEGTGEEKLDLLKKVLTTDVPDVWELPLDEDVRWFAIMAKLLPWEFAVKFISDVFELDFWDLHDEIESNALPCKLVWIEPDIEEDFPPVVPIKTTDFIGFGCSDDDRAFYWTPDGDVKFSNEMTAWMGELRAELDAICAENGQLIEPAEFYQRLYDLLRHVYETYWELCFFAQAFTEFVIRAEERSVQAAVILLERMAQRYRIGNTYVLVEGQKKIKRYMAILANKELRKAVLGF